MQRIKAFHPIPHIFTIHLQQLSALLCWVFIHLLFPSICSFVFDGYQHSSPLITLAHLSVRLHSMRFLRLILHKVKCTKIIKMCDNATNILINFVSPSSPSPQLIPTDFLFFSSFLFCLWFMLPVLKFYKNRTTQCIFSSVQSFQLGIFECTHVVYMNGFMQWF